MDSCFVALTDFILRGMDKGFYTGMILDDLQKALDTLDHTILLQKWNVSVLRSQLLNGFNHISQTESYFVKLENVFSNARLINCGVPQGSILGPLLFLTYTKDLAQALNETGSYLYADNNGVFYQDKDVEKIEKILNKEFSSLCEWFVDNKLSIHFGDEKTKRIFFLLNEKPTKTKQTIWRLLSKIVQYCRISQMLP